MTVEQVYQHEIGIYDSDEQFADYVRQVADDPRKESALELRDAELDLQEVLERQADAREELNEAERKGADGAQIVLDAQERLVDTNLAQEAIEVGEPLLFAYDDHKTSLLQTWLPEAASITYITDTAPYATPARALTSWRQLIERQLHAGANRVRVAGDVPHPGYGVSFAGWDRYEAALDHVFADMPVTAPCLYDARITPPEVLDRARSLHRFVREPSGARRPNDGYRAPTALHDFLPPERDPLELLAPTMELWDLSARGAREAVRHLAAARLTPGRLDDLVLAVSEAVTNGSLHGGPPVVLRCWIGTGHLVVNIRDGGSGPTDPLVGLVARADLGAESGRGLNIVHQLDLDVALFTRDDGFTVRLRMDLDQ